MPAKRKGDPGTWGTKRDPLLVSVLGWNAMHPFVQDRIEHAHLSSGYCIRNTVGPFCSGPERYDWQVDCDQEGCAQPAVHWDDAQHGWVCGVHKC